MFKKRLTDITSFVALTLPFLMITVTFVGLAFFYGDHMPSYVHQTSFEMTKLGYTPLP